MFKEGFSINPEEINEKSNIPEDLKPYLLPGEHVIKIGNFE